MNMWMAFPLNGTVGWQGYRQFYRDVEMDKPDDLFVFIHEDPTSIEDGVYRLNMDTAVPPGLPPIVFENAPAALHNKSTSIGFADGRSELHKWAATTIVGGVPVATATATDVLWLKSKATQLK